MNITAETSEAGYRMLTDTGIYLAIPENKSLGDMTTETVATTDNPADFKDFYDDAKSITGLYIYPVVCLFGLIGNLLTIIVLAQTRLKTSTNVYLIALAISDAIKLLNDFLYFLVTLIATIDSAKGQEIFSYLYPYAHYIFNASACLTAWLTVSVAVERYIFVCHPATAKSMCTISRARLTSALVFIIVCILAIPSALRYRSVKQYNNETMEYIYDVELSELWQHEVFATAYIWIQNLVRAIIPLFVLIVLNSCIIHSLRRTRANRKMRFRNRITMMLVSVIIVFLVCITPDAIMSTFLRFGYTEEDDYLAKGIREISDTLLAVNSAVNIILYSIFNKLFRLHFMMLFCHGSCLDSDSQHEMSSFDKVSTTLQTMNSTRNGRKVTSMTALAKSRSVGERNILLPEWNVSPKSSATTSRGKSSTN